MKAMPKSSGRNKRQMRRSASRPGEYFFQTKLIASPEMTNSSDIRHWFVNSIGSCRSSD